ncbi:MAG: DsbA family protein [Phycisphaerae bacterium]|nr:DsbA family protein [Gemmatimonadaceae bacterium]
MANKVTPAQKSRAPFFLLLLVIVVAGAGGIYYKVASTKQKPIVLAPGTVLPVSEGYLRGKADAPVSIAEFGDFECPLCGQFGTVTEPDVRARIVDAGLASFRFYDFPLPGHANTMSASLAAACADHQGKFWEMHDAIFQGQAEWNGQATMNPKKVLQGYAKTLGLDEAAWSSCFDSQADVARIESHRKKGQDLGVNSTPTFIIDGVMYAQSFTYDELKRLVDSLTVAKGAAKAEAPPAPARP